MENNYSPTPLQKILFERGKNLLWLQKESRVSYPTLVNINRGYASVIIRDKETRKIISKSKKKFLPEEWSLIRIAKVLNIKSEEIFEDRSGE